MRKKGTLSVFMCALLLLNLAVGCSTGNSATLSEKTSVSTDKTSSSIEESSSAEQEEYRYYDYAVDHTSQNRFINFQSSDSGLDDFINDYVDRHMRDNAATRVGTQSVGNSTRAAWREWDSLIGGWWDASAANETMSADYATNDAVNAWLTLDNSTNYPDYRSLIDAQGYIWGDDTKVLSGWGMAWEFPSYKDGGKAWDFASKSEKNDWTLTNDSAYTAQVSASKYKITTVGYVDEIQITTTDFGVYACYSPFLRLGFSFLGTGTYEVDDLYVEWQTSDEPTWTDDKCVKFSDFCTRGFEIGDGNVTQEDYAFPMYLNSKWGADFENRRTITALRITLRGKTKIRGTLSFDFIASEYDDRQPLNNCNYILAAKNNLEFSRDKQLLERVLPNARKAMSFMLYTLGGDSGLISTEYLVGHFSDGSHRSGTGIGDGYWDVDAFPTVNLYCNISYYNALVAMEYLEELGKELGIPFEEVTTADATMYGTNTYTQETADGLSALIATCKARIQKEFWNEETGRFHAGFYDDGSGIPQDHGYLMFNEQVISSGIATEAQKKSILQWINGERSVEGDDSTGEDIWYYEFAPRYNTQDIGSDFYWKYSCGWNGNVQNGGTALQLTYYDILAQSKSSTATAYAHLKNIQSWYEKVKAAGGEGKQFYRKYYDGTSITLQGGNTAGLVGVDYEFLEAALLFRSIPDAFFGMSTKANGTLCFAPTLPKELDWWRMENLVYSGYYYDVSIGAYFLQISSVAAYSSETSAASVDLEVTFPLPSFKYAVYVNGKQTSDYVVADGKLTVNVPFENVKVEIKETSAT